ncbi:MAG: nitroreductase family protein [Methylotenera sp.]|nr:nitroreductase family protein [Methylotenera sp.]
MQKPAVTQVSINETIAKRRSGRAYDASKPITHAQIIALLEAARWAPSCFGDEPWRFIVWDKNADAKTWQQAFDCVVPNNQTWVKDAPVLILVCAGTLFGHNQSPNRWAQYDTGAAAENLCLQAASMGLMAHQMGGFNADKTREHFAIPAEYTPMTMIAVGYEGDANNLPDELKARELAARKRKPLGELFFSETWGKPI